MEAHPITPFSNKPLTKFRRFPIFDEVEILEAHGYTQDFPNHFHETVCITLVQEGAECTEAKGKSLLAPRGGISLTPHLEAHANPNPNVDGYSFLTFYVNPDVICHILGKSSFQFTHRVVQNISLYQSLYRWASNPGSDKCIQEKTFRQVLRKLVLKYTQAPKELHSGLPVGKLTDVLSFMNSQFHEPLSSNYLAQMAGMSPYQFIRSFKKEKGITPVQYLILKRVEAAKKMLREGNTQVDVALRVGFFDQSHFSRNFRRFTGMTPRAYQQGCNLIQEFPK